MAEGLSVGQLIAMGPKTRADVIQAMSPVARRKLAHLASIAARESAVKGLKAIEDGREAWIEYHLAKARRDASIAAELTADHDE